MEVVDSGVEWPEKSGVELSAADDEDGDEEECR